MTYTDVMSRISQIGAEVSGLSTAFTLPAPGAANTAATAVPAGQATFSSALASAIGGQTGTGAIPATASGMPPPAGGVVSGTGLPGVGLPGVGLSGAGASLPPGATSIMTSGQQQFASRLAADTGLDPGVVSAWLLSEENSGAASARQNSGNNDWLNIGYTDGGTYGAGDSVWSDPATAADATAGWLRGQSTIPGYGTASAGIQSILSTVGQGPAAQIAALQGSGWASGGYPGLPALYQQVVG